MRRFARIELVADTVPDESTVLRFRHLLEQYQMTAQIFQTVQVLLERKQLLLKRGTIVDATTNAARSSTKNASGTRDSEMKQTREGQQWYCGMKVHVDTDRCRVAHSLTRIDATTADITQLVHDKETDLDGIVRIGKARTASSGSRAADGTVSIVHSPGCGRACVRGSEAPVGLHEGAVPRLGEEHGAGVRALRSR
jgi:IS5 family transposase